MSGSEVSGAVTRLAADWGLSLGPGVAHSIEAFLLELLRWNARVNLTGVASVGELVGEHLPDSFALARLCPRDVEVVDVGSGGGLPAFPFAVARPDCAVTMVEPRAKRVAFLRSTARPACPAALRIWRGRAEDLPAGRYQVAVSRATFGPDEWLSLAGRLVKAGGLAVVFTAHALVDRGEKGVRLEDSCLYATASGVPRWAGIYRFT